jgi:hypothetical protein
MEEPVMSIPRTLTVLAQDIPYEGRVACEFCRFWYRADENFHECHRNPPTIVPEIAKELEAAFDRGYWPVTTADDWCGYFMPVVTASPDPPPIAKDPGRGMRTRLNAVEGEIPGE